MKERLDGDIKKAMFDKDQLRLNVLRGLKNALINASIQKNNTNTALTEAEMVQIVRKQISQRQDSIEQFISGQRIDLVSKEECEMQILKEYLPLEISDGDLEGIVWLAIQEYENPTKKNMGAIIKKVVEIVNGRADNKRISKLVGEKLS